MNSSELAVNPRPATALRAGLYVRLSEDREGDELGVTRQMDDCRRLAERLGWTVLDTYKDDAISASQGDWRPQYDRLLADLQSGRINAVVAYHSKRLHRNVRELLDFLDLIDDRSVMVETVKSGGIDLSTAVGRALATTLGAWAQAESEETAERIRRKMLALAVDGQVGGGGTRPFGFERDRVTIRDDEAKIVRDIVKRILDDREPLRAVVTDLNRRGVPTVTGAPWSGSSLRRTLCSARLSGQREHTPRQGTGLRTRKRVRPRAGGEIVATAVWKKIIEPAQTEQLRGIFRDPSRERGRPRKYWLSGLLHCGQCEHPMNGRPRDDGKPRYFCPKDYTNPRDPGGCGKTFALAEPADSHILELFRDALADAGVVRRLRERAAPNLDGLSEALAADEQRLIDLGRDLDDGLISRREWLDRRDRIVARVKAARRDLQAVPRLAALTGLLDGPDAFDAAWEAMTEDGRRAAVRAGIERIDVGPAVRGRNRFDPSRFDVLWIV